MLRPDRWTWRGPGRRDLDWNVTSISGSQAACRLARGLGKEREEVSKEGGAGEMGGDSEGAWQCAVTDEPSGIRGRYLGVRITLTQ